MKSMFRVLGLIISILLLQNAHCIFINKKLYTIAQAWNAVMIQDFGFEKGGTLAVSIKGIHDLAQQADLKFAVLPYNLLALVVSEGWDVKPELAAYLCQLPMTIIQPLESSYMFTDLNQTVYSMNTSLTPSIHPRVAENLINKTFVFVEPDHYAFILLRCEPTQTKTVLEIEFSMTAMNQRGQHLSTQNIPLILVSFVMFLFFVTLNFYWAFTVIKDRRHATGIHYVVGLALICQTIGMFGRFNHYQILSRLGSLPFSVSVTVDILAGISEAAFLLIMLLVSMGWTITIEDLGTKRQFIVLSFTTYMVFRILYAFCQQPALCPAYVLSFRVVKYLILFSIIIALNQTAERLSMLTSEQQFAANSSEVFIKLKMMKTFRSAFLLFIVTPLGMILVEYMVVSWVNSWVLWAINELVTLYINWIIVSVFCPKVYNVSDQPDEDAIVANAQNAQRVMDQ
ncbi:hypothetical protein AKO1_005849 [Acrasis kona]|uniref:GOST seven transmembrane domain-containing protein n=1 Tax=Acrasis kona TaxID=1008807 RepID=A0AAW2YJZ3_9EUKA